MSNAKTLNGAGRTTSPSSMLAGAFHKAKRTIGQHPFLTVTIVMMYGSFIAALAALGHSANNHPHGNSPTKRDLSPLDDIDLGDQAALVDVVTTSTTIDAFFAAQQPHWGGWGTVQGKSSALVAQCYRQERTAILLSLFVGFLGVDQWYAHHWILAALKLAVCFFNFSFWLILTAAVEHWLAAAIAVMAGMAASTWVTVDFVLWVVGGVYSTPGCGGWSWRH